MPSYACASEAAPRAVEHRHAVLRLKGDLDSSRTFSELSSAFESLVLRSPKLILLELNGNIARPDLMFEILRLFLRSETPTATWLADPADRRVGPSMLAIAIASRHAGIHPSLLVERDKSDSITVLNPKIEDWALVGLDLRSSARDLAESKNKPQLLFESLLAPRSSLWVTRDENSSPILSTDPPVGAQYAVPLVDKDADGWSFNATAADASRVYEVPIHRTRRAFERSIGLTARPIDVIEIESGLRDAHAECLSLVRSVRIAIDLADAALDVRAGRAATSRTLPHEYHTAAVKASGYVDPCREAIAQIASMTDDYPEILQLPPPPDDDAPTQIGGPSRSSLSFWRNAVRDAEYELSRLDDRIATYRRR